MKSNEVLWIEWVNEETVELVKNRISILKDLISRNRIYLAILSEIIKELIAERVSEDNIPSNTYNQMVNKWLKTFNIEDNEAHNKEKIKHKLNSYFITEDQMKMQCMINAKCYVWAQDIWNDDLPALYLQRKDSFDIVSFRMMRLELNKKNFGNEIYHRLKNKETSFKEACMTYGNQADRITRGRVVSKRIDQVPKQISQRLNKMSFKEISSPFELDNNLVILELVAKESKTLDAEIEEKIINDRLNEFVKFAALKLASTLQNQHSL